VGDSASPRPAQGNGVTGCERPGGVSLLAVAAAVATVARRAVLSRGAMCASPSARTNATAEPTSRIELGPDMVFLLYQLLVGGVNQAACLTYSLSTPLPCCCSDFCCRPNTPARLLCRCCCQNCCHCCNLSYDCHQEPAAGDKQPHSSRTPVSILTLTPWTHIDSDAPLAPSGI
jgi:hypothetical protein